MNQNNKWRPNQNFFSNLAVVLLGILFYLGLSHLDLVRGGPWAALPGSCHRSSAAL